MRKNLRGRKATAIALASVMAMSLASLRQAGWIESGGTDRTEGICICCPNTWSWTIIRIPATVT